MSTLDQRDEACNKIKAMKQSLRTKALMLDSLYRFVRFEILEPEEARIAGERVLALKLYKPAPFRDCL